MPTDCDIPRPKPYPEKGRSEFMLSILICHLCSRKDLLERLLAVLKPQIGYASDDFIGERYFESTDGQVQIIVEEDNGKLAIGAKRNKLLERSGGRWICYVDDDDLVALDYVAKIIKALESNPDACAMEGIIYQRQHPPRIFSHSVWNFGWYDHGGKYFRTPNHLNPVRRSIAMQVKFPCHLSHGEDRWFSQRVSPLIETEAVIPGQIYFYHAYRPGETPCTVSTTKK